MPKVISIHEIEVTPGADLDHYHEVVDASAVAWQGLTMDGWQAFIVRGDRGARKGQYAIVHIFDSMEARGRYFPTESGAPSELLERIIHDYTLAHAELEQRWGALVYEGSGDFTDYVVVGHTG